MFNQYMKENIVYTKIMSEKLKMTHNSLLFNQIIAGN